LIAHFGVTRAGHAPVIKKADVRGEWPTFQKYRLDTEGPLAADKSKKRDSQQPPTAMTRVLKIVLRKPFFDAACPSIVFLAKLAWCIALAPCRANQASAT